MRIGLGQFDAVVGDLEGNAKRMREIYGQAVKQGVDLLVFPELAVCSYPPEDLLLKKHFLDDNRKVVEKLARKCPGITIVAGFADYYRGKTYNAAGVLQNGRLANVYRKGLLPNEGVFDEPRYFEPGNKPMIITLDGLNIAITICRDIWDINWLGRFLKERRANRYAAEYIGVAISSWENQDEAGHSRRLRDAVQVPGRLLQSCRGAGRACF